jgi:hypothetical protein
VVSFFRTAKICVLLGYTNSPIQDFWKKAKSSQVGKSGKCEKSEKVTHRYQDDVEENEVKIVD